MGLMKTLRAKIWLRTDVPDERSTLILRGRDHEQLLDDDGLLTVRLAPCPVPLRIRPGFGFGTDAWTVWELFFKRAYDVPLDWERVHDVLDIGANIGLLPAYLLSRKVPLKRYVGVEPDAESFGVLSANMDVLRRFGVEATAIQAAAGDHDGTAHFDTKPASILRGLRDDGDTEVRLATLPTLLAEAGLERADLLKIDIEGGEADLLPTAGTWADRVDRLLIELHHGLDGDWLAAQLEPAGLDVGRRSVGAPHNYLARREPLFDRNQVPSEHPAFSR